jgi:septum formation protein
VRLILASTSPYRRMLLERLGLEFSVESPGVAESHAARESPPDRAVRLATVKARAVAERHRGAVVIGSDQVAAAGVTILDKPGHAAAARAQLAELSGSTALFHTACAVVSMDRALSATHLDTTRVVFRPLSPEEIERYVAREQPFDCAGSFKVEALGVSLLERIESEDPTALIGLPLIWLAATLRALGCVVP